jgi:predicted RNase H-like nuclease (RuvC/YqgF family)
MMYKYEPEEPIRLYPEKYEFKPKPKTKSPFGDWNVPVDDGGIISQEDIQEYLEKAKKWKENIAKRDEKSSLELDIETLQEKRNQEQKKLEALRKEKKALDAEVTTLRKEKEELQRQLGLLNQYGSDPESRE